MNVHILGKDADHYIFVVGVKGKENILLIDIMPVYAFDSKYPSCLLFKTLVTESQFRSFWLVPSVGACDVSFYTLQCPCYNIISVNL